MNNFCLGPEGAASKKLPHATRVNRGRIRLLYPGGGRVFFSTRRDTALEVLALRHQLAVLKRKRPRPPVNCVDRLFWITLRRLWSRWTSVLVIVKPDTAYRQNIHAARL